jgi:hypothetical protein
MRHRILNAIERLQATKPAEGGDGSIAPSEQRAVLAALSFTVC